MRLHLRLAFVAFLAALVAPGFANNGWAAAPEPTSNGSTTIQLSIDPYLEASDVGTSARPVVLCRFPTLDCNTHPDGTPCGDPELFAFCHCTSNQGQHFCVKNP